MSSSSYVTPTEKKEADAEVRLFSYAKTLRKLPVDQLKEQLRLDDSKTSTGRLTETERAAILSRQTWTDVVSETHQANESKSAENKRIVIQRLTQFGYKDAEAVFNKILHYLQHRTLLVVSFKAEFLKSTGILDYQLGNLFERNTDKGDRYRAGRDMVEQNLFAHLSKQTKPRLFEPNFLARPRYGALVLTDNWNKITSAGETYNYGRSFVVLKPVVKLNCLFAPHDSYNRRVSMLSSYGHLEQMLAICSDNKLKALAGRVTRGLLGNDYDPKDVLEDGYLEAHLPAINLFDPNLVEHIYIDSHSYQLTPEELKAFEKIGITVTNSSLTPYPQLWTDFMDSVQKRDSQKVAALLEKHPSLIVVANNQGEEAIHLAAKAGDRPTVQVLLKYGAKADDMTPDGRTALAIALANQHITLFDREENHLLARKLT